MAHGRLRGSVEVRLQARALRRQMTAAEAELWNGLRGWGFAKFRRQHPVDRFILDFYCPAARLCVELDGSVHDAQADRDEARTAVLEARGIHVLRFRNHEVETDCRSVLHRIKAAVRARSSIAESDPPGPRQDPNIKR
jgi:very-short-patch-repair endonuclease